MKTKSLKTIIKLPTLVVGIVVILSLVLAACASAVGASNPTATAVPPLPTDTAVPTVTIQPTSAPAATATSAPAEAATTAPTKPTVTEATISVATDAKLGSILVGNNGMTLYMYTKDEPDKSNCAAGCLKAWPPLLTLDRPMIGDGVDKTLVGTADLADGTRIVTYNHMPLYYWAKDAKAGDTTGQDVNKVWYVVSPAGKPVGIEVTLNVAADPKLGKILVDSKGMTLYMYTKDAPDKSNCTAGCLKAWPPFLTQGSPILGEGVDKTLVGTADLADGTRIVTYNHMPLYFWAKDARPGDTTGQDVNKVWYVVSPDGKPVGMDVTLNVAADPKLGKILVDGKGMTLYMFTKDEPDKSNCDASCLKAWPPFLTQGNPILGDGVDKTLIGSATLADGTKIVTYNHFPLYYWAGDAKTGDTTGQGVGKVWYVIGPDGKPIGM